MKFEKIYNSKINNGCVIWITGLSGAGKTTLSKDLGNSLKKLEFHAYYWMETL